MDYQDFVAACRQMAKEHMHIRPQDTVLELHDKLARLANEHGYRHRPEFISFVSAVNVAMLDGIEHASFWVAP